MELGVLYDLRNPPSSGISNQDLYAETLDHIAAMEALGFDVVWLTVQCIDLQASADAGLERAQTSGARLGVGA